MAELLNHLVRRPQVTPKLGVMLAAAALSMSFVVGTAGAREPQRWVPAAPGSVLPAGAQLSNALVSYARINGWQVQWGVAEDYALDRELELPGNNVIADVQWVLRTYQDRGVFAGVGVLVDSNAKRIQVTVKEPSRPERDRAVELRMSSLQGRPLQVATQGAGGVAGRSLQVATGTALAPLPMEQFVKIVPHAPKASLQVATTAPALVPMSALAGAASSTRLVPMAVPPKDPNNPGLVPTPVTAMSVAQVRDVRADAALVAARNADRHLAEQSAARWNSLVEAVSSQPTAELDVAALLPPPELVSGLPSATASVESAPAALSLGAAAPAIHEKARALSLPMLASVDKSSGAGRIDHAPALPADDWRAPNGTSLRTVLESWGKRAGWVIQWDAAIDYPVVGNLTFEGEFLEAVDKIIKAYGTAERPLRANAYSRQNLILVQE